VALAYRGQWRVQNAFRTLKTPLELRPLFRTHEAGIDANAKEALRKLDSIHHSTFHLVSTYIERSSTPTPEQAANNPEPLTTLGISHMALDSATVAQSAHAYDNSSYAESTFATAC